jgi:tRNA threonylcarbamoyladenosine biosynthesis protein TsaE
MTTLALRVESADQMRALGEAIGRVAQAGDRFLLEGPFGAGKTTFAQGLARGLDIAQPVGSPSFVIQTQYRGRLKLYHVDLYRLDRVEPELLAELEEDLYGDGVTAVEWAERLPAELRDAAIRLHFEFEADDTRRVTIEASGHRIIEAVEPLGAKA